VKKKPEVSFEDFEKQVLEVYAQGAKKLPGVKGFVINVVRGAYGVEERPVDCVAEFNFADEEAFKKTIEMPEAKSLLDELGRVAERSEFVYSEEKVVKKPRAPARPKARRPAKRRAGTGARKRRR